jgi:UDP-N-acetyl-D-mannosaminuronate dehydrogenase
VELGKILVVGLGEVGSALASVIERRIPILRHDIEPLEISDAIDIMHICIPFQSPAQFENAVTDYIDRFHPRLTVINSTVQPGTTRAIMSRAGMPVAYSPVRGKHARMTEELLTYVKFVAAEDAAIAERAAQHFREVGMTTRTITLPDTLELAKLAETTYFGVLIAFAQELNRYAKSAGADYDEITEFFNEVKFLPDTKYFPGFIGGHCVIPNIHLLLQMADSTLLKAALYSNALRAQEIETAECNDRRRDAIIADGTRRDLPVDR